MKNIITSREEMLLSKIAGNNVSINTMTPPVAMNLKEKLMLDIAERLDTMSEGSGGGGGSGAMVVTLTNDSDVWTSDIEPEDIAAAFEDGTPVYIYIPDNALMLSVLNALTKDGETEITAFEPVFFTVNGSHLLANAMAYYASGDGGWNVTIPSVEGSIPIDVTPIELTAEQTIDGSTISIDFGMTAQEAYELAKAGRKFLITITMDGEGTVAECVSDYTAIKKGNNEYWFCCDTQYRFESEDLAPNDNVVLTSVN